MIRWPWVLRVMAENYGFTPADVAQLTPWQLRCYLLEPEAVRRGEYKVSDARTRRRFAELRRDPIEIAKAIGYRYGDSSG